MKNLVPLFAICTLALPAFAHGETPLPSGLSAVSGAMSGSAAPSTEPPSLETPSPAARFSLGIGAEHQPALAGALPPGVVSARLLPGWELPNGSRMTALDLELQPGWKTYWRNPGDGGIPADFDWEGSENLEAVQIHWPMPEVIDSGGLRSLGYHERLVLPLEITPHDADAPIAVNLRMDLGLCETICVPGHLVLSAPPIGQEPDPLIEAALAAAPLPEGAIGECRVDEIRDGLRLSAQVPVASEQEASAAALEFDGGGDSGGIWVSEPVVQVEGGRLTASADFIDESGKPFALDMSRVRLTLIGTSEAWEFEGCP